MGRWLRRVRGANRRFLQNPLHPDLNEIQDFPGNSFRRENARSRTLNPCRLGHERKIGEAGIVARVLEIVPPEDSAFPDPHESWHLPDISLNQARSVPPRKGLHTPAPDL